MRARVRRSRGKHDLGLLLLWASHLDGVPERPASARVEDQLAKRTARAIRDGLAPDGATSGGAHRG